VSGSYTASEALALSFTRSLVLVVRLHGQPVFVHGAIALPVISKICPAQCGSRPRSSVARVAAQESRYEFHGRLVVLLSKQQFPNTIAGKRALRVGF